MWISPLPIGATLHISRRGFALEVDHGIVSVKYHNGTVLPVAHISGSSVYRSLMKRFAADTENLRFDRSRPPPRVDERDVWTMPIWIIFHAKRWLNKFVWLPATPETRILADMVTQLRREAEAHLRKPINAAALSTPDAVRLTYQEVQDVFAYLGLEDLVWDEWNSKALHLYSFLATMAGYGLGLCEYYTHAYECALEERFMPTMSLLKLDFNSYAFGGELTRAQTARQNSVGRYFIDFGLGLGSLSHEEKYWERIRIRNKEFVGRNRVNKLLLTGTHASEPEFLDAVRDALSPLQVAVDAVKKDDAASIGMAEFAKWRLEGMARCWLPDGCLTRRGLEERAIKDL
ncbi:hypothetical protein GQ53DRAFT_815099 [Thozetella sp. PMI_491]|nr:hypothetical protein GQ53DRAFT_815099 [Thozetella sp. PMI_491]